MRDFSGLRARYGVVGLSLVLGAIPICLIIRNNNIWTSVFLALNHWAAPQSISSIWSCFTMLGDATVVMVMMAPLLFWQPRCFAAIVASFPAAAIMDLGLKWWFNSPRPGSLLDVDRLHVIGRVFLDHSFPAGHAITAFAMVSAILAILAPSQMTWRYRVLAMILLSLASLVAFSRIAVGAHWLGDILAGALIGYLAGLNGAWLSQRYVLMRWVIRFQFPLLVALLLMSIWLFVGQPDYPEGKYILWLATFSVWLTLIIKGLSKCRNI